MSAIGPFLPSPQEEEESNESGGDVLSGAPGQIIPETLKYDDPAYPYPNRKDSGTPSGCVKYARGISFQSREDGVIKSFSGVKYTCKDTEKKCDDYCKTEHGQECEGECNTDGNDEEYVEIGGKESVKTFGHPGCRCDCVCPEGDEQEVNIQLPLPIPVPTGVGPSDDGDGGLTQREVEDIIIIVAFIIIIIIIKVPIPIPIPIPVPPPPRLPPIPKPMPLPPRPAPRPEPEPVDILGLVVPDSGDAMVGQMALSGRVLTQLAASLLSDESQCEDCSAALQSSGLVAARRVASQLTSRPAIVVLRRATSIFSPWFTRRADFIQATIELVEAYQCELEVRLFTKNEGMSGSGIQVDSTTIITAAVAGRYSQEWNPTTGIGLGELLRFRFTVVDGAPPVSSAAHLGFRVLSPVWYDAVVAPS